MTIEELIDWAKHRGYYEEITPEDIANAMFQQGSITLSEYLEITEILKAQRNETIYQNLEQQVCQR